MSDEQGLARGIAIQKTEGEIVVEGADCDRQLPDPPIEPEVTLGGFDRIDMPIDWLSEDWALALSGEELGAVFRLYASSLRQSPSGSLPGDAVAVAVLVPGHIDAGALSSALALWPLHSDGRRYWSRVVPMIEDAWGRRRGKSSKEAVRKRRERLRDQLIKCGLTPNGASNADVQAIVMAELSDDSRMTFKNVYDAASRAGVIGPVRPLRPDSSGQSTDSPGQSTDSPRTVSGQSTDSPRTVSGQS